MRKVVEVHVEGLFGHASHVVHFRRADPTIILAPNGAGKTHVLRLTSAALSLDGTTLIETIYRSLSIKFDDGRELSIDRLNDGNNSPVIGLQAFQDGMSVGPRISLNSTHLDASKEFLPPEVRQVGPDLWADERTGMRYTASSLRRRFGVEINPLMELTKDASEIKDLCGQPRPVFIDTWRLDSRLDHNSNFGDWDLPRRRSTTAAVSRIRGYTEKLREEITEARRASIQATQSADLSFAARALEAASMTVREDELHRRYDETVERYEALARNGLAVGEAPMAFPEKTTPTVRRILSVFLDDWDRRLKPLIPVNEKLQTLRDILDDKLAPSGKRTAISDRGELEFRNASGNRLPVSRLSSGEQHLVALFTLLLFAAKPGSLVLIDEPEISLHAAWKHAFLEDITRVSEVSDLQVAMATHSAGIVNGRWDLTEELTLAVDDGLEDDDTQGGVDDVDFD